MNAALAPQLTAGKFNQCPLFNAAHSEIAKIAGHSVANVVAWKATGNEAIVTRGLETAARGIALHNALAACVLCKGETFTEIDLSSQPCPTSEAVFESAIKGENYFDQFKPTTEG